ncbi:LOW QUALITY PROTEIN: putative ras-dva small gtpase [Schistosoma mansoni]|uniref:putative ras-dva small gtpase n=1 Tax=Schistosoma mansoni TaxID=6183 RepID=UPI00022DCC21|nr:LOW QUALITY PROTEIN: putative ras-dva small gtpase [Schistosoma mansoni]|eukprot:XP_018654308.1 LOW QUALITY PROTEIN: putative ras-dva small gtpase [Schistosoma mansoni]
MDDQEQPHAEVVFMGEAQVGKTALVQRIIKGSSYFLWDDKYEPTIEDSFVREFIVGGKLCRLRLIDTSGSYTFPAMNRLWQRRASAFVLVCARDNPSSLDRIKTILKEIQDERQENYRKSITVIVVNKSDIRESEWLVKDEDVEQLAENLKIPFSSVVTASARDNYGMIEILKVLWEQNQEAGENRILFDLLPSKSGKADERRASAFAVLFGNSSSKGVTVLHTGYKRPRHSDAQESNNMALDTNTKFQNENSLGIAFIRKIGRLSLGGHRSNKRDKTRREPSIIKPDCNVS